MGKSFWTNTSMQTLQICHQCTAVVQNQAGEKWKHVSHPRKPTVLLSCYCCCCHLLLLKQQLLRQPHKSPLSLQALPPCLLCLRSVYITFRIVKSKRKAIGWRIHLRRSWAWPNGWAGLVWKIKQCRVRFDWQKIKTTKKKQALTKMKMFFIGLNFKCVLGDERLKDKWQHAFSYWLKTEKNGRKRKPPSRTRRSRLKSSIESWHC